MKLIIDIPEEKLNVIKNKMYCGIYDSDLYKAIAHGTPLDDVMAEMEKHQHSREYCCDHNIDTAIDMGMVRIILNSIGKESVVKE